MFVEENFMEQLVQVGAFPMEGMGVEFGDGN
jgi:hypothetical protein